MWYDVYLLTSLGAPRDHQSLFIGSSPATGGGYIFQVSGNIQTGMYFNHRSSDKPELEPEFLSKSPIGRSKVEDFENGTIKELVERTEPPIKQFEGGKRLVTTGELRRCQEWVKDVISEIRKCGALQ